VDPKVHRFFYRSPGGLNNNNGYDMRLTSAATELFIHRRSHTQSAVSQSVSLSLLLLLLLLCCYCLLLLAVVVYVS